MRGRFRVRLKPLEVELMITDERILLAQEMILRFSSIPRKDWTLHGESEELCARSRRLPTYIYRELT